MLFTETDFAGRNSKLAPKWIGPVVITDVNDTNAQVKLYSGKLKVLNVNRLKPFFEDSNAWGKFNDADEEFENCTPLSDDQLIKLKQATEDKPRTRQQTRLLQQAAQFNQPIINSSSNASPKEIDDATLDYLRTLACKLYITHLSPQEALTPQELEYWCSFDRQEVLRLLTGNPLGVLDHRDQSQLWSHAPPQPTPQPPIILPCPVHLPPDQAPAPPEPQPSTSRPVRDRRPPERFNPSPSFKIKKPKVFKSISRRLASYKQSLQDKTLPDPSSSSSK